MRDYRAALQAADRLREAAENHANYDGMEVETRLLECIEEYDRAKALLARPESSDFRTALQRLVDLNAEHYSFQCKANCTCAFCNAVALLARPEPDDSSPVPWSGIASWCNSAARAAEPSPRIVLHEPMAYLHEVVEQNGNDMRMYSRSSDNPWSHWVQAHRDQCKYTRVPLYDHPRPEPEHHKSIDIVFEDYEHPPEIRDSLTGKRISIGQIVSFDGEVSAVRIVLRIEPDPRITREEAIAMLNRLVQARNHGPQLELHEAREACLAAMLRPEQSRAQRDELLKALGDLSFSCFAGIGLQKPPTDVYNETFLVLQRIGNQVKAEPMPSPPAASDAIETLARKRFDEVHNVSPVHIWDAQPDAVKNSYREWAAAASDGDKP